MGHKKRGYTKDIPEKYVRDYKLFAIACEGEKREPEYFRLFSFMSKRIKVDIIEDVVSDENVTNRYKHTHRSAPRWVLDRAITYIDKEGLIEDDELWFVIDTDRWTDRQIRYLVDFCNNHPNWHIAISNPCFEVWLYFHKSSIIENSLSETCEQFKYEISTFEKGGYHPCKFITHLQDAIDNAKKADKDPLHFNPFHKTTKVYLLAEALLAKVGINDFVNFIEVILPTLIKADVDKMKVSRKKSK